MAGRPEGKRDGRMLFPSFSQSESEELDE